MSFSWMKWTPLALALLLTPGWKTARGDDYCNSCQRFCCPHQKHCTEGGPNIRFCCGCGRPIANPCSAPNWGYHQTCWSPWPWGPDWSHCPVQPPASVVWPSGTPEMLPPPNRGPTRIGMPGGLPLPRPVD